MKWKFKDVETGNNECQDGGDVGGTVKDRTCDDIAVSEGAKQFENGQELGLLAEPDAENKRTCACEKKTTRIDCL